MNLLGIDAAITAAGTALDKLFTSDDEKAKAQLALETLRQQPALAQNLVNQLEAQNTNWFVSGWRPAVGWMCVMGLGYQYILRPLLAPWLVVFDIQVCTQNICTQFYMPTLEIQDLFALLTGMLGLSVTRTWEKVNNASRN